MTETSQLANLHLNRRVARACGVVLLGSLFVCQSPALAQTHPVLAVASEGAIASNVTDDLAHLRPASPRGQESQGMAVRPGISEPRSLLILAIGFFGIGALASRWRAESH